MDACMPLKDVSFSAELTGEELTSGAFPTEAWPPSRRPSRKQTPGVQPQK